MVRSSRGLVAAAIFSFVAFPAWGSGSPRLCLAPELGAIDTTGGELSWNGLRRGMTADELRRMIDGPLVVDRAAHDEVTGRIELDGREVVVFFDADPPEVVYGFHVPFTDGAKDCSCAQLDEMLRMRHDDLVHWSLRYPLDPCVNGSASYGLGDRGNSVLLLKAGRGLYWIPSGWAE